jgi:hypothetical protein
MDVPVTYPHARPYLVTARDVAPASCRASMITGREIPSVPLDSGVAVGSKQKALPAATEAAAVAPMRRLDSTRPECPYQRSHSVNLRPRRRSCLTQHDAGDRLRFIAGGAGRFDHRSCFSRLYSSCRGIQSSDEHPRRAPSAPG